MAGRSEVLSVVAKAETDPNWDPSEYVTSKNVNFFGDQYTTRESIVEAAERQEIDVLFLSLSVEFVKRGGERIYRTGDSVGGVTVATGTDEERAATRKYVREELTRMAKNLGSELSRNDGVPKTKFLELAKKAIDEAADSGSGRAS